MFITAQAKSLDITFPEPTSVPENEVWKYGIEPAKRIMDDKAYVSITIDERMLCPVKFVQAQRKMHENSWENLEVIKASSTYGTQLANKTGAVVKFTVHCLKKSNIHRNRWFSYDFLF